MARRNRSYMSLDPVTQQRTRVSVTSKSTNESIQEFVALAARRDLASRHKSLETKGGTDWPRLQELVDSLRGNEAFSPDVIERLQGFVDAEEATNEFRELVEAMVDEGGDGSDVAQDMLDALGTGIYGDKAAGSSLTTKASLDEVIQAIDASDLSENDKYQLISGLENDELDEVAAVWERERNDGEEWSDAVLEYLNANSKTVGSSLTTKGTTPIGSVGEALDVLESMDDGFGGFDHWIDALKEVYDSDLSDPDAITEAQAKIEKVRREVDGTEWVNAEEDETGPSAEWYLDKANQVISLLDEAIADLAANGVYDERSAGSSLKSKSNDELVQFLRSAADDAAEFADADAEIGPGGGDGAMEQAAALAEAADHVADGNLDLALQALNDAPQDGSVMREAIERVETEIEGMASDSAGSSLNRKGTNSEHSVSVYGPAGRDSSDESPVVALAREWNALDWASGAFTFGNKRDAVKFAREVESIDGVDEVEVMDLDEGEVVELSASGLKTKGDFTASKLITTLNGIINVIGQPQEAQLEALASDMESASEPGDWERIAEALDEISRTVTINDHVEALQMLAEDLFAFAEEGSTKTAGSTVHGKAVDDASEPEAWESFLDALDSKFGETLGFQFTDGRSDSAQVVLDALYDKETEYVSSLEDGEDNPEYAKFREAFDAAVSALEEWRDSNEKSARGLKTKAGGKAHLESILDSLLKGAEGSLVDGDPEASANLDAIQETINALDQAGDAQDADELEQLAGVLREQFSVIGNSQSTDLDDLDQFIAAAKDE